MINFEPMAEKVKINPSILQWARKTAKITEEQAAAKAGVSLERYQAWERGDDFPTISKAQKLAHDFRRPFALFFFPMYHVIFSPFRISEGPDL